MMERHAAACLFLVFSREYGKIKKKLFGRERYETGSSDRLRRAKGGGGKSQ